MSHIVIIGGGSALAQPLIEHYESRFGWAVTAVCRKTAPDLPESTNHPEYKVVFENAFYQVLREIDVLVTMPGKALNSKLSAMSADWWYDSLEANLSVPALAIMKLLPSIKDGGNIIVVGSIVGSTGGFGCANYAAAKAGLVGLVRATANEIAHRGICCNLLELGYCNAGMGARLDPKVKEKVLETIPLKRFAEPQEFVEMVDFLSRIRYATGNTFTLAGGLR